MERWGGHSFIAAGIRSKRLSISASRVGGGGERTLQGNQQRSDFTQHSSHAQTGWAKSRVEQVSAARVSTYRRRLAGRGSCHSREVQHSSLDERVSCGGKDTLWRE